jgi:antirestriction protein ArdC
MSAFAYDLITSRIIALLEQGTVPWHRPWDASTDWPRNLITQKEYRGINVWILLSMAYKSPFWLTFRQASQLGGHVRKAEKACPVVFWKTTLVPDKVTQEQRAVPFLRYYYVFNVAQCDGLDEILTPKAEAGEKTEEAEVDDITEPGADLSLLRRNTKAEAIAANMPQRPTIRHGMRKAFYSLMDDTISLPVEEDFESSAEYYAALFHELIHATGHETRLHRPSLSESHGYGSDPYCKEELVAEIGAAFLCGQVGIIDRTIDNSAAYIQGWLKRLQADRTLIIKAAAQAEKAVNFILGVTPSSPMKDATDPSANIELPEVSTVVAVS